MAPPTLAPTRTSAHRQARQNLACNLAALVQTHPHIPVLDDLSWLESDHIEPVFGRDGSLTLRIDQQWLAGCSVPQAAAIKMISTVVPTSEAACLLLPPHAAYIRAALDHLGPSRTLLVILPNQEVSSIPENTPTLEHYLACDDFSEPLSTHRLLLCRSSADVLAVYRAHPGLSIPTFFIKLPILEPEQAASAIESTRKALSTIASERHVASARLMAEWQSKKDQDPKERRSLLLALPMRYRLWQHAPHLLADIVKTYAIAAELLDLDAPVHMSGMGLQLAAAQSRALLTADLWRDALPNLIPLSHPWHVWITNLTPPPFKLAGPHDLLLLAHQHSKAEAAAAGWPASRVRFCPPSVQPGSTTAALDAVNALSLPDQPTATPQTFLLLADLPQTLAAPSDISEYSSLRLLWESLQHDLIRDPARTQVPPAALLDQHVRTLQVPPDHLDRQRFITECIMPARVVSLAMAHLRSLHKLDPGNGDQHRLILAGANWKHVLENLPETLAPALVSEKFIAALLRCCHGDVGSYQQFLTLISKAKCLIDWRAPALPHQSPSQSGLAGLGWQVPALDMPPAGLLPKIRLPGQSPLSTYLHMPVANQEESVHPQQAHSLSDVLRTLA